MASRLSGPNLCISLTPASCRLVAAPPILTLACQRQDWLVGEPTLASRRLMAYHRHLVVASILPSLSGSAVNLAIAI